MKNGMNGAIKIERGVPIPTGRGHTKGYSAVIRKMKVGDSAVLPVNTNTCHSLARQIFGGTGYVATRKVDAGHSRIWRIK